MSRKKKPVMMWVNPNLKKDIKRVSVEKEKSIIDLEFDDLFDFDDRPRKRGRFNVF